MKVHATEFLRRFLQHALPTGFQEVRHYGYLSPRSRTHFEAVRWRHTARERAARALHRPFGCYGTASDPTALQWAAEATSIS